MAQRKASVGIQDLIDRTAGPKVRATVVVDQIYAANQHESLHFQHPRGGQAKYLEAPLFAKHPAWIQSFANRLLAPRAEAANGWASVGRNLKNEVPRTAPVEFGDLRQSAALMVREGSQVVVDEPPRQGRLTESELAAKDFLRSMGVGYRE